MITRCPRCSYSLRGLPTVHRCPECGLECDANAVVFREPRVAWIGVAAAIAALLLWRAVSTIALAGSAWSWSNNGPLLAFIAVLLWWSFRQRNIVVVSACGLQVFDRSSTPEVLPFEEMGDAHWNFVTGTISVSDRLGNTIKEIPVSFLGSPWRSLKLVRELKKRLGAMGPA